MQDYFIFGGHTPHTYTHYIDVLKNRCAAKTVKLSNLILGFLKNNKSNYISRIETKLDMKCRNMIEK